MAIRWASPSTMAVLPTPGSPIRAGLFLVRRERIWMTRSISLVPADDRVQLAGPRRRRQVHAHLIDDRGAAGLLGLLLRVRLALAEHVDDLGAHLLQADAEALQHAGGDALALAHQTQKQMLGADVVVVEAARLVHRQLDHLLGPWSQADLARDGSVAAADDELDGDCEPCCSSTPRFASTLAATPSPSRTSPSRRCSVPM